MSEHKFSILPGRAIKDPRVTDSIYRTLAALCAYANSKNGWCFPAQGTLAEDVGKSRKTVNEHLQLLEEWGYIKSGKRATEDNSPTSKMYQVVYDVPEITQPMSTLDYSAYEYSRGYTNDSLNDPMNDNTASSEKLTLCRNCKQPIFYDERDTLWFHAKKTSKDDNGYYCAGEGYLGKHAEPEKQPETLPIEWQIAAGVKQVNLPDQNQAKMVDSANLIAMGTGAQYQDIYRLAMAFMVTRNIVIPFEKAKGNRKAAKSMLAQNVQPVHVIETVQTMLNHKPKPLTCVDLFSVEKMAVDLANPAETGYNGKIEGV